jgi:hypothetical protein
VCLEVPIAPFETPCHHRMCLECAEHLPLSGAAPGTRLCPMCRAPVLVVEAQPVTQKALDDAAAVAFPDTWAFWQTLKAMAFNCVSGIFEHITAYIRRVNAASRSALVLLRLSKRYKSTNRHAHLYLEPLLKMEASHEWDGIAPWLDRILAIDDPIATFLATTSAAESAHSVAAPRIIKAIVAHILDPLVVNVKDYLANFVSRYISKVDGGWAAIADAPGTAHLVSLVTLRDFLRTAQPVAIVPLIKLLCRVVKIKPLGKDDVAPTLVCIDAALARSPVASDGWAAISDGDFVSHNVLCTALFMAQPLEIVPVVKLLCRVIDVKPLEKCELAVVAAAVQAALARAPAISGGWASIVDTPGVASVASFMSLCVSLTYTQPPPAAIVPLISLLCRVIEGSPPGRDGLVLAASAVKAGVSRAPTADIAAHTAAALLFAGVVIKQSGSAADAMALLDQFLPVAVPTVGSALSVAAPAAASAAEAGKRKRG